jgi:hypothetical protein
MQKLPYGRCCLMVGLGFFAVVACVCLCLFATALLLPSDGSSIANSLAFLNPSPTPITTCRGEMDHLLNPFADPPGEKITADGLIDLAMYDVSGDTLSDPEYPTIDPKYAALQQNAKVQHNLWDTFTMLIPPDLRRPLTKYKIATDGTGSTIAAQAEVNWTYMGDERTQHWTLIVDPADYSTDDQFTGYLIHEYGHFLTLSVDQIDVKGSPEQCPWYQSSAGCAADDSYLLDFYNLYWKSLDEEWSAIAAESDPIARSKKQNAYVDAHPNHFVSYYAFTNPREDIAESWRYFILAAKPKTDTLAHQKILFFYRYPALVQIRSRIIGRLCEHYHFPADS